MRNLMNLLLMFVLVMLAGNTFAARPLSASAKQQNEEPNASPQQQEPQQQEPSTPQGQASSSAVVQSVTGCVVQTDQGYSLKTDTDTYPIETGKDLSQYVNKQVRVTGILEHHNTAAPSASTGNASTITDLRLRMVATVIGDCNQPQK
jgi:hypothetical protein